MGQVYYTAQGLAVLAFYVLDFALNALQASLRNLVLDMSPPSQLGQVSPSTPPHIIIF